jgi:hypothetical protein
LGELVLGLAVEAGIPDGLGGDGGDGGQEVQMSGFKAVGNGINDLEDADDLALDAEGDGKE